MSRIVSIVFLTGCVNAGAQSTPVLGPGSTPGKSLATVWLSPTPPSTLVVTPEPTQVPEPTLPLPTAGALIPTLPIGTAGPLLETEDEESGTSTPSAPAASCESQPPAPFLGAWSGNPGVRERLGCPTGVPQERTAAYQRFEQGFMFWIQAEGSIYVLANSAIRQGQATDQWWRLADTFTEGEPSVDDSLVPPGGLLQPSRGFGKVWRNNGFVREALGWATAQEVGYSGERLDFEGGWMLTAPGGSPVFAFVQSEGASPDSGAHLGPNSP